MSCRILHGRPGNRLQHNMLNTKDRAPTSTSTRKETPAALAALRDGTQERFPLLTFLENDQDLR
eukprot:6079202-Prorocentrum_lima.AAC.1